VNRATPPFFLVGNPRSGTKMLRELLNASPDIWLSDVESHFIPKFTRRIGEFGDLAERPSFDRLTAALRRTRAFWQWERRGVRIDGDEWWAACRTRDWPGVVEALFHCVHRREIPDPPKPWEEIVWGDKTPVYMRELPLLARLFPQARFIHIVRDPRDCCLSAETAWGNFPLRTAQEWADRTRACRAAGAALGPARYCELRYEDLVADVRRQVARVFDFLGVPTPADAGRLFRVPENLGAARGATEVVATNTQKWKERMSPALRRRIEALTGDQLDALRYEREHPDVPLRRLSPAALLAYRVRDAWRQLRFRRRELGSWTEAVRFLRAR
jgi:hypothetical protein